MSPNSNKKSAKSNNPRESAIQTVSKSNNSSYNMIGQQQMSKNMKKFIACLLLGALLGMIPPLLPAQQNQNTQKSNPEIEALKKRVSELEQQLQTVENVEKMDLARNYADAKAKLINVDVDKLKWELRDSNHKWLTGWILFFLAILSAIGVGVWSWLKSRTNQLIETEVEKNLNGFKEAVGQVDTLKNQQKVLEKEHVAAMLDSIADKPYGPRYSYPERIKALSEEALLWVLDDEIYGRVVRYLAAEVLANRKSPQLPSLLLKFLNSVVDWEKDRLETYTFAPLSLIHFLEEIYTHEVYQGLKRFLNRLLTENPKNKDLFLPETVSSLAGIGVKLNMGDSVPILKTAIPHLKNPSHKVLSDLARYFDIFNEPAGIKEILINHVTSERSGMEEVENRCLELLQKYGPAFVAEWRARATTDNSNA